jgi:hypothetical protein
MEETTRLFGDAAAAGRDTVSTAELLQIVTGKKPAIPGHSFFLGIRDTREFGIFRSTELGVKALVRYTAARLSSSTNDVNQRTSQTDSCCTKC